MELPPSSLDGQPVVRPTRVTGYRIKIKNRKAREEVLVEWERMPSEESSWEELSSIARLDPSANLEDKVRFAGEGNVTVHLQPGQITDKSPGTEEEVEPGKRGEDDDPSTEGSLSLDARPTRPVHQKRTTRLPEYEYQ